MGIAPVVAIPKVLEMTGLAKEDVDVWEVRTSCCCRVSQLDPATDQ